MYRLPFAVFAIIAVVLLAAMMISAARRIFTFGQLQGFREAIDGLTRGVSLHYEHDGEPIPDEVAKVCRQNESRRCKSQQRSGEM
jgi:hypothetical protein